MEILVNRETVLRDIRHGVAYRAGFDAGHGDRILAVGVCALPRGLLQPRPHFLGLRLSEAETDDRRRTCHC